MAKSDKLKEKLQVEKKKRLRDLRTELKEYKGQVNSLKEAMSVLEETKSKELEVANRKLSDAFSKALDSKNEIDAISKVNKALVEAGNILGQNDYEKTKLDQLYTSMLEQGLLTQKVPVIQEREDKNSVARLSWKERKKLLNGLKFTKQIKQVPSILAHDASEALKAVKMLSKLPQSKGVMIKDQDASYPIGVDTNSWVKFQEEEEMVSGPTTTGTSGIGSIQGRIVGRPILPTGKKVTDEEWKKIHANLKKIEQSIHIKKKKKGKEYAE